MEHWLQLGRMEDTVSGIKMPGQNLKRQNLWIIQLHAVLLTVMDRFLPTALDMIGLRYVVIFVIFAAYFHNLSLIIMASQIQKFTFLYLCKKITITIFLLGS